MTPAARISSDTWRRLARAHLLDARLGEETLTDLLALEMLHFQNSPELPAEIARPEDVQADGPEPYLEPLRIDLPDSLLRTTEPLPSTTFDQIRSQMDEQSDTAPRGKALSEYDPLYPRKLLIVDYAGPFDEDHD